VSFVVVGVVASIDGFQLAPLSSAYRRRLLKQLLIVHKSHIRGALQRVPKFDQSGRTTEEGASFSSSSSSASVPAQVSVVDDDSTRPVSAPFLGPSRGFLSTRERR